MRGMRMLGALATAAALTLGLAACAAASPAATAPAGDGPLVAFYGDSYTLGTGASDSAERWSSVISAERGWREFNPSVNGLGFVNNRSLFGEGSGDLPDRVIAEGPEIVIVTMGLNDAFSFDRAADRIRETIRDDFQRLHEALPAARIVVFEPFWYTGERPPAVDTIAGWVKESAAGIGADYVAGPSHWLDGHYADDTDSWMAADGLHPNDAGYRHFAERADAALRALDPPL